MDSSSFFGSFPVSSPLASTAPVKLVWHQSMVEALLQWVLDHEARLTDGGHLQATDNRSAAAELSARFRMPISEKQVKSKLRNLNKTWSNWTYHNGHLSGWNPGEDGEGPRNDPEIEDEHFERYDRCREFRDGAIPKNLDLLAQIHGQTLDRGQLAVGASQSFDGLEQEQVVARGDDEESMDTDGTNEAAATAAAITTPRPNREASRGRGSVRRQRTSSSRSHQSTRSDRESTRMSEAIIAISRKFTEPARPAPTWIGAALEVLYGMEEVRDWSEEDKALASDLFIKNPSWCEAFATYPEARFFRLQRLIAEARSSVVRSSLPPVQESQYLSQQYPSPSLPSPSQQWQQDSSQSSQGGHRGFGGR